MGKFCHMLHLEAPPKNTKKINKYWLSNIELVLTHTVFELGMFGIAGKLSMPFVTLCQKKFNCSRATQNPINHTMVDRNFKG